MPDDYVITCARLGEFLVPTLTAFDPARHVKPSDVKLDVDRTGATVTTFTLPVTKTSPTGERVQWARQHGAVDPEAAMKIHLRINKPPSDGPLFAYKQRGRFVPLTRSTFLRRLTVASRAAGMPMLQGHGIRIGATLEYLLRGIPFDVVKVIGRWQGESFLRYLREHAQILAPYLQASPALQGAFIRYTMPPAR